MHFMLRFITIPRRLPLEFQAGKYDVALIDIRMPKMNGFELYNEIRKKIAM